MIGDAVYAARGTVFYVPSDRQHCNAISNQSGHRCNAGVHATRSRGRLELCLTHLGMLYAGWSFCNDPHVYGQSRWNSDGSEWELGTRRT